MNRDGIKRILQISIFAVIILIVGTYIYISFKDYANGPQIIITSPENGSTIATSTVVIKGQVIHVQEITFNNKPILIDQQGNFTETLLLSPGYNIALFSAQDKFKRTTEYKLELVYQK